MSSELIREAVAATRWRWPTIPPLGMVSFIDTTKVKRKRDPGRCYLKAGWHYPDCADCEGKGVDEDGEGCELCGETGRARTKGGLVVVQLLPSEMPPPREPIGATMELAL